MNDNFYKQLIKDSPIRFAYNRIICDADGSPGHFTLQLKK